MRKKEFIKRKIKILEIYLVLILIATFVMSVAFAQISDVKLDITGTVVAPIQDGVFISDIVSTSTQGVNSQEIKYYRKTTLSTSVSLTSSSSSYINYKISLYNNSATDYYFTGVGYDQAGYDNTNITYILEGLEPYITTIHAKEKISFNLKFKYKDGITVNSSQTLNSMLTFNFSNEFIDFKIDKESYTAPKGATWEQFVNSEYNTNEFTINNNKIYSTDDKAIITSKTAVALADVISEELTYEYEDIEITLSRTSGSSVMQGNNVVYNMEVTTNGTFKTRNVQAKLINSYNSEVSASVSVTRNTYSESTCSYTITINTSGISAGKYKIKILKGSFVTNNNTSSEETISTSVFTVVSNAGGNTIGGNTIGGNTIGGNTIGGNTVINGNTIYY